jgi:hypothetical protein
LTVPTPEPTPTTILSIPPEKSLSLFFQQSNKLSPEQAQTVILFNNPSTTPEQYSKVVADWDNTVPIFPSLKGKDAKIRFIKEVLKIDDLDSHPYQTPDLGEDMNGDGIIELTPRDGQTYNEKGEVVDETSFVCTDFAKEMAIRYGITVEGINTKPKKYYLPMFTASTSNGYNGENNWGQGHRFNGIFLSDSTDDYSATGSWLFLNLNLMLLFLLME